MGLGSAEVKTWTGVENPHCAEVLTEFHCSTVTRICTGHAGPHLCTQVLLRFPADYSRSKGTVLEEVSEGWIKV